MLVRTGGFASASWINIDLADGTDAAAARLHNFIYNRRGGLHARPPLHVPVNPVVNIAGSRESKAPGIALLVKTAIVLALSGKGYFPGEE